MNSENLEDIKPELSEENKSRIASAFAQTDATQKQDQLSEQMTEQDAISGTVLPAGGIGSASGAGFGSAGGFGGNGNGNGGFGGSNSTTSTATGDIKLSGVKKKSKLPLVLAVLALVAVIGGVVAWMVLRQPAREEVQSPLHAFEHYRELLVNGPSDQVQDGFVTGNGAGNEWFIFSVGE